MQCYTCNLSAICKVFQMINDTKMVADITVNNCRIAQGQVPAQAAPGVPPAHPQQLRPQRTPEQLSDISERIRQAHQEMKEAPSEEVELLVEVSSDEEAAAPQKCGTCEQETSKVCAGCGNAVCEGCSVESAENGKQYCEPCWDKL
jgi:hypothetical protein